jgi:hypothetical protein
MSALDMTIVAMNHGAILVLLKLRALQIAAQIENPPNTRGVTLADSK